MVRIGSAFKRLETICQKMYEVEGIEKLGGGWFFFSLFHFLIFLITQNQYLNLSSHPTTSVPLPHPHTPQSSPTPP